MTERYGHCVCMFCPNGEKIRSFGMRGLGHGLFDGPYGIAVDNEGNFLVADCWNHCIQKLRADGHFIAAVWFRWQWTAAIAL